MRQRVLQSRNLARFFDQRLECVRGDLCGGIAHESDQNRLGRRVRQDFADRLADIRALRASRLVFFAGMIQQRQQIGVAEGSAAQDDRAGDFDAVVGEQQHKIDRRCLVVGQPFGQRNPDRHFDIAGKALQNFAHQGAFAL